MQLLLPTIVAAHAALVAAQVQGFPPPPVLLTTTKSGVLPVLPTPFSGVETLEGAIINPGPANPGFNGLMGPAVVQTNQPQMTYTAELPNTMFDPYVGTNISGRITGMGTSQGVMFSVRFDNLPDASYGPFGYHIHAMPVPSDGNCTATMGHLDPTNRGEYYPCDTANPQSCQAGDLAGKHGKISPGQSFTASYLEPYLSTDPSSQYFFGDKSIVVHTSNTTRLICANFQMASSGSSNSSMVTPTMPMTSGGGDMETPTPTGGMATQGTSAPSTVPTAAAGKNVITVAMGVIVALLAVIMSSA